MSKSTVFVLFLAAVASFSGTLAAQQKEIVIPADHLAAAGQWADQPTPGKWWLKRNAQEWAPPTAKSLCPAIPAKNPPRKPNGR